MFINITTLLKIYWIEVSVQYNVSKIPTPKKIQYSFFLFKGYNSKCAWCHNSDLP